MCVDVPAVAPDQDGLDRALARQFDREDAAAGPLVWGALVRWFDVDPDGCARWARSRLEGWPDRAPSPAPLAAVRDQPGASAERHAELGSAVLLSFAEGDGIEARVQAQRLDPGAADRLAQVPMGLAWGIETLFRSEVSTRLGSIPYLLSTPTRRDGLLSLEALHARLTGYGSRPVGPIDLFLALTRLEPTPPTNGTGCARDTGDFTRCGAPLWRPGSSDSPSAGAIVADWLSGGGLPARPVHHDGAELVADGVHVPVPLETFGVPPALARPRRPQVGDEYMYANVNPQVDLSMLPTWVDFSAVRLQGAFDGRGRIPPRWLTRLADAPTPGPGVIHLIATSLVHDDEEARGCAVEAGLLMARRGLWQPASYAECCRHLVAADTVKLPRLIDSWTQLVATGGPGLIWPAATLVVEWAASRSPRPAQLASLLELLTLHIPPAHASHVPAAVRELADARGRSRAQVAARAFVAAATPAP